LSGLVRFLDGCRMHHRERSLFVNGVTDLQETGKADCQIERLAEYSAAAA